MCENIINEINRNITSLENFVFLDESAFHLNGLLNKHIVDIGKISKYIQWKPQSLQELKGYIEHGGAKISQICVKIP